MKVHALFGAMSQLTSGIERMAMLGQFAPKMFPAGAPELKQIETLIAQAGEIRKKIVATKEGGAITGEERLREHTDQLYSAILSYEGRPGQYQIDRIAVLTAELAAVQAEFGALMQKNAALMETVKAKMQGMPMGMQQRWQQDLSTQQVAFETLPTGALGVRFESAKIAAETD